MAPSKPSPGPHHPPPPNLADRDLPLRSTGQPWFRFQAVGHNALYWGTEPPRRYAQRFDAPNGEYGVLYAAADAHGAFIETFGHNTGIRHVGQADLASRNLVQIEVNRPLHLVDLTGSRLAQIGADARLFAGEIAVARLWSQAFHDHQMAPDGICYHARHDPDRLCAAMFDRAALAIQSVGYLGTLADYAHRTLLVDILNTYKFGLNPA